MTFNKELLRNLVTWAAQDHEDLTVLSHMFPDWGHWQQTVWAVEVRNGTCQTAYCIAGQACMQAGWKFDFSGTQESDGETLASDFQSLTFDPRQDYVWANGDYVYPVKEVVGEDGKVTQVPDTEQRGRWARDVATEVLGIHVWEASMLFDGDNSIEQVVAMGEIIAQQHGTTLDLIDKVQRLAADDVIEQQEERYYEMRVLYGGVDDEEEDYAYL